MAAPPTMQAHSFLPRVEEGEKGTALGGSVYSETNYAHRGFGWAELHSWRSEKYLYVQAPKRELYDQSSDTGALQNLAAASKAVADTLEAQLSGFQQKTNRAQTAQPKLDPVQAEKLRALGYLATDSPGANSDAKSAIDPKDRIEIANAFHRALVEMEDDHYDEAIAELRDVIHMEPDMNSGYLELGRALVHRGDYSGALPVLRTAAVRRPDSGMAHYELGLALIKTGQWEAALPEMQASVVCAPNSAQLHFYAGAVHLRLKHIPQVTDEVENSLKIDPDHFLANLKYGEMVLREGDAAGALPKLSPAGEGGPKAGGAPACLAHAYQQIGQAQNASRERAKAAQLKTQAPEEVERRASSCLDGPDSRRSHSDPSA